MNQMTVKDTSIGALATAKPTVLGESQARIPIAGRIRSGIKVLVRKYTENREAVALYERGIKAGAAFDMIDKTIIAKCFAKDAPRSVLTPKNVPYFTVRPGDFTSPEMAASILQYATDGEHGRQLYRFPVIFPMDNWQAIMPHEFAYYTAGERRFWSEYAPDGQRFCMTHAAVPMMTIKGKQVAHRPAGGRAALLRADNGGLCNPDICPQYQARECTLAGRLIFYVPGVPGTSAIELPTRSFYSLQQIRQTLEMVSFVTGGKVSGTIGGKSIFWIAKRQQEVSMIDPATGKAKRVNQFLIALESTIDMTMMYQAAEAPARLAAGAQAAVALGAPADTSPADIIYDDAASEFDPLTGEILDREPLDVSAATPAAAANAERKPDVSESAGGSPLTLDSMLAAIAIATNIDAVNDALDLTRGLNEAAATTVKKAAAARVKVLSGGGA